ncbi:hypothetical protein GCM10022286_12770 [Gryllotalpicola daejeonensis]|uniref:Histidine kinase/HSP90-like ATPase domain-containing protein n=1 Tax=Gryllotalpicola daejeonensis TaxID=993087 RepID=A0ABP7ZIS0_9MICO
MTTEHHIDFAAPPADVNIVHEFLDGVWSRDASLTADERLAFELALVELAANVMQHADTGAGVACRLRMIVDEASVSALLSDTGRAGDIDLAACEMPDELSESGRGLALVQLVVDELGYQRVGSSNLWTIRKARAAA